MKIYFKILGITGIVHIVSVCIYRILVRMGFRTLPVFVFIAGLAVANLLGIVLPFMWCQEFKRKIITILLLPANYLLMIVVAAGIFFVKYVLNILYTLPENFG